MQIGCVDPGRLVFVDEMGAHTSLLAPLYAYAPVGERAFFEIPRNRGTNTTLLSSLHLGGMGPSMAVEGATTKEVFDTYVEHFLIPALRPGQLVVMDNLGAHRPKRVRELIQGLRASCVPATLLPGPQPYRGGLLEGQGHPQEDRRRRQRGSGRGDGSSIGSREHRRREGILSSLWLWCTGAITMKDAVRNSPSMKKRLAVYAVRGEA
jgi:hypothetical protein